MIQSSLSKEQDIIIAANSEEYDFLKLAEECTELSEVLIKMVTKPNRREERIPHLIEEMGDVKMRLEILMRRMGVFIEVGSRASTKLKKLAKDAVDKKYPSY